MNYIPRKTEEKLLQSFKTRPAVLVTGARQTGKTTLLQNTFPSVEYVTFDNILLADAAKSSPQNFLKRFTGPVILDETQYVPELFRGIKEKIDRDRDKTGQWLLTGSQRFELMENVSESLSGRTALIRLDTLSAGEILNGMDEDFAGGYEIILRGGYPELWRNYGIDRGSWFEDYIRTYIERDLKSLVQVRSLTDFRRFLGIAASRSGDLLNMTDLGKSAGVANNTAKSWLSALETSGIISLLPPYYSNIGKRLIKTPKLYFSDTGLLCHLLNIPDEDALSLSPSAGNVWENFVFTELIKTRELIPGRDLFFYRDVSGKETDFIIAHSDGLELIEAKKSERVRREKLPFSDMNEILSMPVKKCSVAAPTGEPVPLPFQDFEIYDPRAGNTG